MAMGQMAHGVVRCGLIDRLLLGTGVLWTICGSGAVARSEICFLATGKSGIGHLRRVATIAGRLRSLAPSRGIHLITNARPDGLSSEDLRAFDSIHVLDRARMATDMPVSGPKVLVLDTITVPGVEKLDVPLALLLREAPDAELHRFRLQGGREWDLVLIANPADHWMPTPPDLPARKVLPVGWIYRPSGGAGHLVVGVPQVLVATGGGGTASTSRDLYARLDLIVAKARKIALPFEVVQAIGPRAQSFGRLAEADRVIDPGASLNERFQEADVVISTAGYNSVLELAMTDTPTLLVPIPRSIDDQCARARLWAPRVGMWDEGGLPDASANWLADEIVAGRRRPPVELGPSGEDMAARAILNLG
jgi:spore coat polysaccharide biosynthesis predicted glycosyltransferase SpsG